MSDARDRLVAELREHALVIGEVTLTSGRTAQYYVDAKRAILRPAGLPGARRAGGAEAARDAGPPRWAASRWARTRWRAPPWPRAPR